MKRKENNREIRSEDASDLGDSTQRKVKIKKLGLLRKRCSYFSPILLKIRNKNLHILISKHNKYAMKIYMR